MDPNEQEAIGAFLGEVAEKVGAILPQPKHVVVIASMKAGVIVGLATGRDTTSTTANQFMMEQIPDLLEAFAKHLRGGPTRTIHDGPVMPKGGH